MSQVGALLILLGLTACNQILGIEVQNERDAGEQNEEGVDGGGDADIEYGNPSAEECSEYCDTIKATCSANNKAAFAQESYCRGLCPHMQITEDRASAKVNTFDCRLRQVKNAAELGTDNVEECKASGAGGADKCGSDCEGYCQLYESVCGKFPGLSRGDTCVSECEKLAVDPGKDAVAAFGSASDTLQCRLAHLGAASSSEDTALVHCEHAALALTTKYTPTCVNDTPRCEDFCSLAMNACTGDMKQYDTFQDCVAICSKGLTLKTALGPEQAIDIDHDTVACRRYHLYNAVKSPDGVHCEHGGPTGDGHCGKICPSYCQMAKAACPTQYAKYVDNDACEAECNTALEKEGVKDQVDHHYNVSKGKASGAAPMQCRVYHLSKAFLAAGNCAAALGGGECQ
jgi:hypothetical protein